MTPTPRLTFPDARRLKKPAEFERTYARKKSAADGVLVVYACENRLPHPRLGCSVSRKVGGAVVRNRYKRLFREAFRTLQHELPAGVDFILIPRAAKEPPPLDAVKGSLLRLARQAAQRLKSAPNSAPQPAARRGKPPSSPPPPQRGEGGPARRAGRGDTSSPDHGSAPGRAADPSPLTPLPHGERGTKPSPGPGAEGGSG